MQEIERKFLVKRDGTYKTMATHAYRIAQGYMDCRGATVRVRMRDEQAFLTIKGPSRDGGLSRYEFEHEIPVADAREMLSLCRGGVIEKIRYIVPFEGHTFEVDEFHGANEGLLFCEVELQSADESFASPPFLGPEVTGNHHFYNKNLLAEPYPLWRSTLPEEYR